MEYEMRAYCCPKCGFILWRNELVKKDFLCEICDTPLLKTDNGATFDQWVNEFPNKNAKIAEAIRSQYCLNSPEFDQSIYGLREKVDSGTLKIPKSAPQPHCPTCGSTHVRKITSGEKVANTLAWGIFGNKRKQQYECLDCKYRW